MSLSHGVPTPVDPAVALPGHGVPTPVDPAVALPGHGVRPLPASSLYLAQVDRVVLDGVTLRPHPLSDGEPLVINGVAEVEGKADVRVPATRPATVAS